MRRATNLIQTYKIKILLNLPSVILVLIFLKCEDIDHANIIFRTGPRATYMVLAGDSVPAGTTLVTPALHCESLGLNARNIGLLYVYANIAKFLGHKHHALK